MFKGCLQKVKKLIQTTFRLPTQHTTTIHPFIYYFTPFHRHTLIFSMYRVKTAAETERVIVTAATNV